MLPYTCMLIHECVCIQHKFGKSSYLIASDNDKAT